MLFCCKFRADFLRSEDYKIFLKRGEQKRWNQILDGRDSLDTSLASSLARGIFKWAKRRGAKFYCHKFFPLTGQSAQKFSSFSGARGIEKFSGEELIKTELDASSFPCGSARSTAKARGYAVWNFRLPIYIDNIGGTKILVLPSLFCTYDGVALDDQTPFLRALNFLDGQATSLLRSLGQNVKHVYMTLGLEQEFFLIDKSTHQSRPDLNLTGRTLLGERVIKDQNCSHHYFSLPSTREFEFMSDLDNELKNIGIFAKIQHSEVAPCQFEIVPEFDRADISAMQNVVLKEKLWQVALRHNFVALLHEKPFEGVNGSGKHNNWSLCTDGGVNLFDATQTGKDVFALLFSCVIAAVDKHSGLLRLASSSYSNDMRLGGLEAPPSIVSVFAGEAAGGEKLDLKIDGMPKLKKDGCDRNRTSPFAFTGNKFEFRMLGSNQSAAFCNLVIASALGDEIKRVNKILAMRKDKIRVIRQLTKNNFASHQKVIFNDDNYSSDWAEESKRRGLKNFSNFADCIDALSNISSQNLLVKNGIFSAQELATFQKVMAEQYCQSAILEAKVLTQMLARDILPKLIKLNEKYQKIQKKCEKNAKKCNFGLNLSESIEFLIIKNNLLNSKIDEFNSVSNSQKIQFVEEQIAALIRQIRTSYDKLETLLPRKFLPYPTFNELLS